jgi:hypothetical protein
MSAPDLTLEDDSKPEGQEPLEFLAQVMAGIDPRQKSEILQLIDTIEEENFGDPPDEEQWESIKRVVKLYYTHQPVPLGVSAAAARTIAEYKHAKRKSLEITETGAKAVVTDLTDEELDLFEAWFNAQY